MGAIYGYSAASTVLKPSRADVVHQIAYHESPFLAMFMNPKPEGTQYDPEVKHTTHKWTELPLGSVRDKLKVAMTSSGTTNVAVYTQEENVHYVANRSYIIIDDEVLLVTAASKDSPFTQWTLTTTRAQLSTTAAAHKAGTDILGTENSNYCQIFRTDIKMSGTAQAVQTYTKETDIMKQIAWKMPVLMQMLETALANPAAKYDSGAGVRFMGGFPAYVSSGMTLDAGGQAFNLNTFDEDVERLCDKGVKDNDLVIVMGGNVRRKLNELKANLIQESMKVKELDFNLTSIVTAHNRTVKIAPPTSRIVKPNEYYIFPKNSVAIKFLRAYQREKLGKLGDADRYMLVMEATAEFHNWQQGGALRRKNVY
jgi:hypothetical protein